MLWPNEPLHGGPNCVNHWPGRISGRASSRGGRGDSTSWPSRLRLKFLKGLPPLSLSLARSARRVHCGPIYTNRFARGWQIPQLCAAHGPTVCVCVRVCVCARGPLATRQESILHSTDHVRFIFPRANGVRIDCAQGCVHASGAGMCLAVHTHTPKVLDPNCVINAAWRGPRSFRRIGKAKAPSAGAARRIDVITFVSWHRFSHSPSLIHFTWKPRLDHTHAHRSRGGGEGRGCSGFLLKLSSR